MKVHKIEMYPDPKWALVVYIPDRKKLIYYSTYAPIKIQDVKEDKLIRLVGYPLDSLNKENLYPKCVGKPQNILDNFLHDAALAHGIAKKLWPEHREFLREVSGTEAYVPECAKRSG